MTGNRFYLTDYEEIDGGFVSFRGQPKLGLWYHKDSPFDLVAYTDSDYAGASLDRKSTTGGCQFLGCRLISWQCKKQTVVANSTTEAEYIVASNCCGQVLWIQNQLLDYGYNFMKTKIHINNESTICIVKNPIFHSKTKHIEIRHHFIRGSNEKKLIQMIKIHTDQNVADLLTKAFDVSRFQYLIAKKPTESEGFKEIVDFLNANPIKYALTVNPTIYCLCIKQFWDTVKAKTVNGEVQLQALVDKTKVIITESTIRRDLQWEDANVVDCLPNAAIFEQLTLMGIYVSPSHTKKIFGNMKREGTGFSRRVTPLFHTMMVQAHEEMGEVSEIPTDPHHTPIIQLLTSQPQKKQSRRKQRKHTKISHSSGPTEHIADEVANEENVPTQSNDPPLSRVNTLGSREDRLSLKELMDLFTKLSDRVLDLETTNTAKAKEIASLKKRVKKLERKRKSKTPGMKRLFKIGRSEQVISSKDEGLGDQEDASKQGRKIADIDADAEVTVIDETQGKNDDNLMFDTGVLDEQEVEVKKVVSTAEVTTKSATTTTIDELTLTQTLIEIKAAKPKVRGVMIQEPSEFTTTTTTITPAASKPS
ncbi:hypothetical protein Tco_0670554 [Tanacetum coccineum]